MSKEIHEINKHAYVMKNKHLQGLIFLKAQFRQMEKEYQDYLHSTFEESLVGSENRDLVIDMETDWMKCRSLIEDVIDRLNKAESRINYYENTFNSTEE